MRQSACADLGIVVLGGGGVQVKSNGQFQRNLSFFKVQEGVKHFPGGGEGGVQLFLGGGGGFQLLIPYRNSYNWMIGTRIYS